MFTRFEEYAATQMLGQPDSPPRNEGKLFFSEEWQRTVFGLALALSKEGHFEWEDFRHNLINAFRLGKRMPALAKSRGTITSSTQWH